MTSSFDVGVHEGMEKVALRASTIGSAFIERAKRTMPESKVRQLFSGVHGYSWELPKVLADIKPTSSKLKDINKAMLYQKALIKHRDPEALGKFIRSANRGQFVRG